MSKLGMPEREIITLETNSTYRCDGVVLSQSMDWLKAEELNTRRHSGCVSKSLMARL